MKSRPDVLSQSHGDIADLKTASALDDESINRSIYNYGYTVQAGITQMVLREVYGPDYFQSFTFVFVEKTPPYDVRIKQLEPEDIDRGEALVRRALELTEECLKRGEWPGYDGFEQHVSWASLPGFARTRIQTRLDQPEFV